MDVLMQFIEDQLRGGPQRGDYRGLAHNAYLAWCNANGERPTSKREFGRPAQ